MPTTAPRVTAPPNAPAAQLAAGKFEVKPYWGLDLGSEHERYITERVYGRPVVLINYPKEIKAFYMKLNPDGKVTRHEARGARAAARGQRCFWCQAWS